ncbi:putative membrane-associated protein [Frankia torreyi]|uniref:Putative membrane-associated protein n=2 Tax=Frankia TaxID=1854 RepID=A0A0D8BFQ8_9ACTN|nr:MULTISPECIES: VTT domain-containing protein [Frankia]KJE22799.1 putative membrane-associated protein [Frankia torreyi]KQC40228.1 hypothetical protein UK82_00955 [Frankia sp. ACN1ag]KQM04845.1 putative membrane-associated protein [Frankia sp. CpI1-P]
MTTFASSTFASSTLALGPSAISADSLIKAGLAVVLLIVFAESGLLIGFFLPGDSLLFTMGMLIARDEVSTPLPVAMILIGLAAVAGDQVGYLIGRKAGPALFRRPDSRLFKQEYVEQAEAFFAKNGPRSIVLARFVPIVRTFTPVIAGASRMNYRMFTIYNIIGGLLWGCGVTLLGFYLGKIDFIRNNIEAMLVLVVLVSVVPIMVEYLRNRRKRARATAAAGPTTEAPAGGQDRYDGLPADGGDEDGWRQGEDQGADPSVTMRLRRGGGGGGGGGRHSAAHRRETARD